MPKLAITTKFLTRRLVPRVCALLLLMLASTGRPAAAASFAVDTVLDVRDSNAGDGTCATIGGACSLRAAIEETNALPGSDVVNLPAGTYLITLGNGDDKAEKGDFDITDSLTINGSGQTFTLVDGNAVDRVFDVRENASLQMSDLTVQNGDENGQGGGIRNEGALNLTNVTVRDNSAKDGGGIAVRKDGSTAILANVTFRNNSADHGGGLHAKDDTDVNIIDSSFSGNEASKDGGGAYFDKGIGNVSRSFFSANLAEKGGGLFIKGSANIAFENVTISANAASKEGGGLHKDGNGVTRLVNVTVNDNRSPKGGGLRRKKGTLSLWNTVVANSVADSDCDGDITSLGNNLDSDGSCQLDQPGDLAGIDPLLLPLADNGGATLTHALAETSPARDAGSDSGCPAVDQRREPRPVDGNADGVASCDIGAYEAEMLYPDYSLQKTLTTLSDPVSGTGNAHAIPGAVIQYTISLGNDGPGTADQDSLIISEAIPPDTTLVVVDFDVANPGPVAFVDGTPASGLTYSFAALGSTVDDIEFSNDGGVSYGYTPVPGADGGDPAVTHIRITPAGIAGFTGADPVAEFLLKVIVR